MGAGRKTEPAQNKILHGNFRKDRHSHGPKVEMGLPDIPRWLPKKYRKVWNEVGPQLHAAGLIAKVDQAEFATLCEVETLYREVCVQIDGDVEKLMNKTPQGYGVVSVLFVVRNNLFDQLRKMRRDFGMNPAARSSLKVGPEQGQLEFPGWDTV